MVDMGTQGEKQLEGKLWWLANQHLLQRGSRLEKKVLEICIYHKQYLAEPLFCIFPAFKPGINSSKYDLF